MARYLLNRAFQILLTSLHIPVHSILLSKCPTGATPATSTLSTPDIPPETRERLRELFGVNQPLWKQYLIHIRNTPDRRLRRLIQSLSQKRNRM